MAIGIYKPGEGYWVRVLTATIVAVITLATVGWSWGQVELLVDRLPVQGWSIRLAAPAPALSPGQPVELLGQADAAGQSAILGTAAAAPAPDDATGRVLLLRGLKMVDGADPTTIQGVRLGASEPLRVESREGIPPVNPILAQGAVAGLLLLLGAATAYWFAAARRPTVEFLIATDLEMKKVNWSTPREIMGSTWVVVGACVLIAAVLFAFDMGFRGLFRLMNVLTY